MVDAIFGEAAAAAAGGDALADLQVAHAVAQRHDLARDLVARHEGQRRLVLVLALDAQHGGEAHARGAHLDQDLARGRRGLRHVLDLQRLSIGP